MIDKLDNTTAVNDYVYTTQITQDDIVDKINEIVKYLNQGGEVAASRAKFNEETK